METNADLDLPPPLHETIRAVQQLSNGKASESDTIPAKRTFTKAFNTMDREGLWKIMQKFDHPERFIQMVRQLHDDMTARATDNGVVSRAFAVTNAVKQGCVLEPTLFNLMFSAMLMGAYRDERPAIRVAYGTDGHLLNHRRIHFQSRQTGRMLGSRIHEHKLAVRRGDALSQVAAHTYEMGHEFDLAATKIVAHAGKKTGRRLIEAWASDENSVNRFIDLAPTYRALRIHLQSCDVDR
nr:unnamed protein product [Spirometra erinaceieuropaei]